MRISGLLLLAIVTGGCAGSLTCHWESDEEQMQRVLHEVEHMIGGKSDETQEDE